MLTNRQAPEDFSKYQIERILHLAKEEHRPALVGSNGERIEIPESIFRHLVRICRMMKEGRPVVMVPQNEAYTTQAAANFLGISRQYLVNLIKKNQIPAHRVGTHHRLSHVDLVAYKESRDRISHHNLKVLFTTVDQAGVYDRIVGD